MERRKFLKSAGVGLAAGAAAMPSLTRAQTAALPEVKWRLASSFPKSLDTIYGAAEVMSKRVAACTGGKFQIQVFAAGEIVPAFGVVDAVQSGTVQAAHTAPYYFWGKDPAFALDTAIPFSLNARQTNAWQLFGGGNELFADFYKAYNIYRVPAGNTGAQMGGWFRKEIKTPEDWKGLKFRIGGWAGKTLQKLGCVPQQIAGGDIYPALEKGTIDAAEWVGPYDDEKLGFYKVVKYYYYPGWWEGGTTNHLMINLDKWNQLPKAYQAVLTTAAGFANVEQQARYDARNPGALKRLVANGTSLRPFPQPVMEACLKASQEVNAETSAVNPDYKRVWESIVTFRNDEYLWWQVAEFNYDSFMIRSRTRG